jgi:hypothetical protein
MRFNEIEIDVLSQQSIDDAKAAMPGQGVGPAVVAELVRMIMNGEIESPDQLPPGYSKLGRFSMLRAA